MIIGGNRRDLKSVNADRMGLEKDNERYRIKRR